MRESELQDICIEWAKRVSVDIIHIDNENGDARKRAIGMRRGAPDLLLIGNSVMFVELKRKEGIEPSKDQIEFHKMLRANGIAVKTCGSVQKFLLALKEVLKKRRAKNVGISFGNDDYKKYGGPMNRISRYYLDRQEHLESSSNLFAIKLSNDPRLKKFPWLCDVKNHCFIATQTSTITSRLLLCGWDVIII